MSQDDEAAPEMVADPPFPSVLKDASLAAFNQLDVQTQMCLDDALAVLERSPWPSGALDLENGRVLAVQRCNLWIVYERNDEAELINVWHIMP